MTMKVRSHMSSQRLLSPKLTMLLLTQTQSLISLNISNSNNKHNSLAEDKAHWA
eukprot:CAMPEP_0114581072 /NCGR_PEP_ID=MMETSP0125-20121206/5214_1 /TAXON_ID=485358 ORGANISM="Aristerostoma sp., Strain ATCC 50986" /NCGR_SAMPLE_ID=MMETSP0125 /ASSEMBLY_ACC=CAM_ASM_000245 /LENGTH=53 /DNA_ID=CAMNT_0001772981 /DNA_START=439 /DNA_END=600 /DNA_ORIENTATION=-